MSHPRQIMLHGGPMNGVCHELWVPDGCSVTPSRIGLPIDDTMTFSRHVDDPNGGKKQIAWYRISCGTGIYMWTKDDEE